MSKPQVAYTIDHEGLKLDIALIPSDELLIHEETIPERLESLKRRIKAGEVQSAPIIVDRKTSVVLDGMHRTSVMKQLGCRFTCVCMLDYFDPRIKVQRWCRIIPKPFDHVDADTVFKEIDLSMEPYELVDPPDEEESLILIFKEKALKFKGSLENLLEVFIKINKLETKLNNLGYEVVHCTEAEALEYVRDKHFAAALYMPKVSKKNVLEAAEKKEVFTPKATRHQLPARPVQVNVPLNLLRNLEISLIEANLRLKHLLETKNVTRYDPGKEWHGRKYDEVLYVFDDS